MSYNLLSGSVEFIGPALGEIENIVNSHGAQVISGAKTFTNITASGGAIVTGGALQIATALRHYGDANTEISFTSDVVTLTAGGLNMFTALETADIGVLNVNPSAGIVNFKAESKDTAESGEGDLILELHADRRVLTIGSDQTPANSDVMVSLSSSFHTGSLFSVGNLKNPILAVSGGNGSHANWKVKVSGTLTTDGNVTPAGNVVAGGTVSGSLGIRGQLLNVHNGLTHTDSGGEKKLTLMIHSSNPGLSVGGNGLTLDFSTLSEVPLETATDGTADYVLLQDYNGGTVRNAKIRLGTVLDNTAKPTMVNMGTGAAVFKGVAPGDSRTQQLRKIKATTAQLVQVTQNTNDIEISTVANPQVTALTSSNTVLSGSTRNEYAIRNISAHGANIAITHPAPRYQVFAAGGNAYNATASLPQITNANVGMVYNIKFLSTENCLVTGSAGHDDFVDGSKGGVIMSGGTTGAAKFKELLAVDMTGAGSYEWVIIGEN